LTEFSASITSAITNASSSCPAGGTKGQVLTKSSDKDYDYGWETDDDSAQNKIDSEGVKNIVNTAVANSFKTLPENFTKAITDAAANAVTKKDFEDAMEKLNQFSN